MASELCCGIWLLPLMSRRKCLHRLSQEERKVCPTYFFQSGTQGREHQLVSSGCQLHLDDFVFSVPFELVVMRNILSWLLWPFGVQVHFFMLKVKEGQRADQDRGVHEVQAESG